MINKSGRTITRPNWTPLSPITIINRAMRFENLVIVLICEITLWVKR